MGRLNNSEFITRVEDLLTENGGKSSVYFTQKRLSMPLDKAPLSEINDLPSNTIEHDGQFKTNTEKYPVLVRVTSGNKESKVSTVVEPENLDQFWSQYAQVLKTGMVGLKKREKKSKKSKVAK